MNPVSTSLRAAVRIDLPRDAFEGDIPLVAVERGRYVGSLHRGTAAVADASGEVALALGDVEQPVFLRSAAKPFQVMPALVTGAIDRFQITARELAVLCASHSAEVRHTDTVLGVLAKAGLEEAALQCGVHPPLHEATARERARTGVEPSPVCNNCSGAHAGMLLACKAAGWPVKGYGAPEHPLQVLTREILGEFAETPPADVLFAIDNCAVPTFRLPLRRAAQAFARLVSGLNVRTELRVAASRVAEAMTSYPEMVAGEGRFDTDLMRVGAGALVCKGGAEGFQGIGVRASGFGIALKITDGNARGVSPASMQILTGMRVLEPAQREALDSYVRPKVLNHQGQQVGRLVPLFRVEGEM